MSPTESSAESESGSMRRPIDKAAGTRYLLMNDRAWVLDTYNTLEEAEEGFQEYDMNPSRDYYIVREDREVLEG